MHPTATLFLPTRPADHWVRSVTNWVGGKGFGDLSNVTLRQQLSSCGLASGAEDNDITAYYNQHTKNVRDFAERYPSHTLIEFDIESAGAAKALASATGIAETCWGKHNCRHCNILCRRCRRSSSGSKVWTRALCSLSGAVRNACV